MEKKIKIILSDLHLGGGRYLEDGNINPAEDFLYDSKLIELIEYYSREFSSYEIEIIINGDFMDFLKTAGGLERKRDLTREDILSACRKIIKGHEEVFKTLRDFLSSSGRKLILLAGNHDQAIICPEVQAIIREHLGPRVLFLPLYYEFDGIFVAHGHQFEIIHRFNVHKPWVKDAKGRDVLNIPWGSYFVIEFLNPLKKEIPIVDKVKPFKSFLKWGLYFETFQTLKIISKLVWFYLRNRLFSAEKERRTKFAMSFSDIMDALLHRTLDANASRILRRGSIHTVVFGHSHTYKYRNFQGKHYFNTGTWISMINVDLQNLGKNTPFTYLFIDYSYGRPVGRLLQWMGKQNLMEEVI